MIWRTSCFKKRKTIIKKRKTFVVLAKTTAQNRNFLVFSMSKNFSYVIPHLMRDLLPNSFMEIPGQARNDVG